MIILYLFRILNGVGSLVAEVFLGIQINHTPRFMLSRFDYGVN